MPQPRKLEKLSRGIYESMPIVSSHEIRLVELLSRKDDILRCNLLKIDLDPQVSQGLTSGSQSGSTGQYEALSYAWGNEAGNKTIWIDKEHEFRVADNLYKALCDLRLSARSRILWIDAICINQGNKQEKSEQIPLMATIYEQASAVVVWAMDMAIAFPQSRLEALIQLELSHWWDQVWTKQEAAAAGSNLTFYFSGFGERSIDNIQKDIHEQERLLQKKRGERHLSKMGRLGKLRQKFDKLLELGLVWGKDGCHLADITALTIQARATKPQDKVYGLTGWLSGEETKLINPDYNDEVWAAFCKATFASIKISGSLEILALVQIPQRFPDTEYEEHHTWAVNFANLPSKSTDMRDCLSELFEESQTKAWGLDFSRAEPEYTLAPPQLILKGYRLYKVSDIFQLGRGQEEWSAQGDEKLRGSMNYDFDNRHMNPYRQLQTQNGEISISGSFGNRQNPSIYHTRTIGDIRRAFKQWPWAFPRHEDEGLTDKINRNCQSWIRYFGHLAQNACFFVTEAGFFGLGPATVSCNTFVTLLHGAAVPALLEMTNESANECRFMGFCYIHGIMENELRDHEAIFPFEEKFHFIADPKPQPLMPKAKKEPTRARRHRVVPLTKPGRPNNLTPAPTPLSPWQNSSQEMTETTLQ